MATGYLLDVDSAEVSRSLPPEVPFDAADRAVSGAGAAVSVTVTADGARPIVLSQIHCGYDATPAAGSTVKVEDGSGNTVFQAPVPAGGMVQFDFTPNKCSAVKGTALIVTLSAGGGAVLGYLNLNVRRHA